MTNLPRQSKERSKDRLSAMELDRVLSASGIDPRTVICTKMGNFYQVLGKDGLKGYVMVDDWTFRPKGMKK